MGALKRDRLSRQPSDNALAKAAGVARDTVGAWLRGERFPQDLDALLTVMTQIRAEATSKKITNTQCDGVAGQTVADLLDGSRWREEHSAERKRRAQANQEVVERQQAQAAMELDERHARQAALADRPHPVRSWTPQRLGVHPAIPGHPAEPESTGFVLPRYVPRPHDTELRERLAAAAVDGAPPLLVVVRGESCTGKTRTAFEALNTAVPDDFKLIFPANADSLLAVLAAGALGPRTVLWLNDAQDYLTDPEGEAAASALLRRLDTDGPLVMLATLWPDRDKTLTHAPAFGEGDPHRHARTLLAQAHRFYVPRSFADDLDAVRHVAGHDRSLATALEVGSGDVTQVLAAGPDLVTHYEHPTGKDGVYGRALISAAMDASRLGVAGPLPLDFLQDAASGYLTDWDRAAAGLGWFTGALAYACTLIKQTTRPLLDVSSPSGMGAVPGVLRLADYLQQHGRQNRWTLCPPAAFWDAAAAHLATSADLIRLADSARHRLRYRHAAELYCAAAEAGAPRALGVLGWMREMVGDQEGAERLARYAAEAGAFHASLVLIQLREMVGDQEGAERLARKTDLASVLAKLRDVVGTLKSHQSTYQDLLALLPEVGDHEGAQWIAGGVITSEDVTLLVFLAWLCERGGYQEGTERPGQAAGADVHAQQMLAWLRETAGGKEGAERRVREAIDAGVPHALLAAARLGERKVDDQEEIEWRVRQAVGAGRSAALFALARLGRGPADAYQRYGLEADGTLAQPWPWPEPSIAASDPP
ncbi:sel1 repeat family protein [Streptomyces canus]|uniref:sel1 repeat family protein n=1 Tax=Streptomyces canus TaxID=58343 RepID=UPI00225064F3|nr:sel1 repeat family protein [Streptomyces canus]MCX5256734.1 sel1 repeat family protein [Streptomyces canus]